MNTRPESTDNYNAIMAPPGEEFQQQPGSGLGQFERQNPKESQRPLTPREQQMQGKM